MGGSEEEEKDEEYKEARNSFEDDDDDVAPLMIIEESKEDPIIVKRDTRQIVQHSLAKKRNQSAIDQTPQRKKEKSKKNLLPLMKKHISEESAFQKQLNISKTPVNKRKKNKFKKLIKNPPSINANQEQSASKIKKSSKHESKQDDSSGERSSKEGSLFQFKAQESRDVKTMKIKQLYSDNDLKPIEMGIKKIQNMNAGFSFKQSIMSKKLQNQYPTFVMKNVPFKENYRDKLFESIFIFPKFARTFTINYRASQQQFAKKSRMIKTLVLDIDETLLFATPDKSLLTKIDKKISFRLKDNRLNLSYLYVSYRPYVLEMLKILSKDYEIILFTTGTAEYAWKVAQSLQKGEKYFDHVLSVNHCLYAREKNMYIKDLKILEMGRNLKDILIVDNNIQSFFLQLSNGIPIPDFNGNIADEYLLYLTAYLQTFLTVRDVRDKVNCDFQVMRIIEKKQEILADQEARKANCALEEEVSFVS